MPMILSVAFPFAPVGPDPVGGAEQVLAAIDQRLAAEAWPSIALAAAGSRVAGELVELVVPGGVIDDAVRARVHADVRAEIARLLEERAIDLVHCHGGDLLAYLPETDVPVVATLHLPAAFYPREVLDARIHRVCVSSSQRRTFGPEAAIPDVIPNGVALDRYRPVAQKGDFVLALGRLCPEKGFDLALDAARAARVPLILAGMVFPYESHQRHVREAIMPRLDAERRWIGSVAGAVKRALLAEARCLLITSRVDETSSLVAMEALASGTPVAGLRRGALPELIEHGRTGYLVDDPGELPEAIARAAALSPEACRETARERASAEAMTARYLELYRGLVRARPRRRPRPAPCDAVLLTTDDELAAIAGEWDALCDRCPTATAFQRPGWLLAYRRWFGHGGEP
ncbi:MAG: glycosyltransferase, partial [Kofleriaceae bacterium]